MAGTHKRRLKSGKTITVRNPGKGGRRAHNARSAPKRKAAQRKMKARGTQLKAGMKYGKGGRIVRDRNKGRVASRRAKQTGRPKKRSVKSALRSR